MDAAAAVQNPVNGADGDPGLSGNVFNGYDCWSSLHQNIKENFYQIPDKNTISGYGPAASVKVLFGRIPAGQ